MSELRRGWWKDERPAWKDAQGYFVRVSREEMQHVRDAFDFVDGLTEGRMLSRLMEDREDILDRGTPPEPEWLPVGVAPNREGVWERKGAAHPWKVQRLDNTSGLWMTQGLVRVPASMMDHTGHRFRRIGDL